MRRSFAAFWLVLVVMLPVFANAQEHVAPTGIAIIDIEAVYRGTQLGKSRIAALEERQNALQQENDRIRDALVAEEQSLTQLRTTMDIDAFRALAAEFDVRVQGIRSARDSADRALTADAQAAPNQFLNDVRDVLEQVMMSRGASIIFDSRFALLSLESIDITAEVIARIDQDFGEDASQ